MRLPWRRASDPDRYARVNRWRALAVFNSERDRGIVHTAAYVAHMREEQAAFDAETDEERAERLRR